MLRLDQPRTITHCEVTHIYATMKPVAEYDQTQPHLFARLEYGYLDNDMFVALESKEVRLEGEAFGRFVQAFAGTKDAFLSFLVAEGLEAGTIDG